MVVRCTAFVLDVREIVTASSGWFSFVCKTSEHWVFSARELQ